MHLIDLKVYRVAATLYLVYIFTNLLSISFRSKRYYEKGNSFTAIIHMEMKTKQRPSSELKLL